MLIVDEPERETCGHSGQLRERSRTRCQWRLREDLSVGAATSRAHERSEAGTRHEGRRGHARPHPRPQQVRAQDVAERLQEDALDGRRPHRRARVVRPAARHRPALPVRRRHRDRPDRRPVGRRGDAAGRLRERQRLRRVDSRARHRRQALPAHPLDHGDRARQRRRHHRRRHRHLPQARADRLGRPPRPGARPRLHQRLAAQRPAAAQGHPRTRIGDHHRAHAHRLPGSAAGRAAAEARRIHRRRDASHRSSAASGARREPE